MISQSPRWRPVLQALLDDTPRTKAVKSGALRSDMFDISYVQAQPIQDGFKQFLNDPGFAFGELALVTFLQAYEAGRPLSLLPITLNHRVQHPALVHDPRRGKLSPGQLAGKRIGVRAYAQTSPAWVRGLLDELWDLPADAVEWVTVEEPHLPSANPPATVRRAPATSGLRDMLLAGELDAALLVPSERAGLSAVIDNGLPRDPAAWHQCFGHYQINHVAVVSDRLVADEPGAVQEIVRLLNQSADAAPADPNTPNINGAEAMRSSIEKMMEYCVRQGIISKSHAVDALYKSALKLI